MQRADKPAPGARAVAGDGFSVGADGQDGGNSMFVGDDQTVIASGGKGALVGSGTRRDDDDLLRVSALVLANYVESRGWAAYVASGAWQHFELLNLPERITIPALIQFEAGGVPVGEYSAGAEVRHPDGSVRERVSFPVTVRTAGDVVRFHRTLGLSVEVDAYGLWTVAVVTPRRERRASGSWSDGRARRPEHGRPFCRATPRVKSGSRAPRVVKRRPQREPLLTGFRLTI